LRLEVDSADAGTRLELKKKETANKSFMPKEKYNPCARREANSSLESAHSVDTVHKLAHHPVVLYHSRARGESFSSNSF
jgi:hypothetical protein